ncbi:MAG: hypothetical protein PHQ54_03285 [Candidatus Omnitrophica bacterium]|nr:hypothetical protein [Candidatus Omnitrophota bacterium]
MDWEEDFDRELLKLKRAFGKMILKSKEFQAFKKKLKEWDLDGNISLEIHIIEDDASRQGYAKNKKGLSKRTKRVSKEDVEFLKRHGIIWE